MDPQQGAPNPMQPGATAAMFLLQVCVMVLMYNMQTVKIQIGERLMYGWSVCAYSVMYCTGICPQRYAV